MNRLAGRKPGGGALNQVASLRDRSIYSPKGLTPGRRWKLRRDIVIYLAHSQGASQRMLGDVFDLPHSRICEILKSMRAKYGTPEE